MIFPFSSSDMIIPSIPDDIQMWPFASTNRPLVNIRLLNFPERTEIGVEHQNLSHLPIGDPQFSLRRDDHAVNGGIGAVGMGKCAARDVFAVLVELEHPRIGSLGHRRFGGFIGCAVCAVGRLRRAAMTLHHVKIVVLVERDVHGLVEHAIPFRVVPFRDLAARAHVITGSPFGFSFHSTFRKASRIQMLP